MGKPEKTTSCYVCGEENKNIEVHCSSHSYSYDNDDYRFTEEVCWQICKDCLSKIEYDKTSLWNLNEKSI